VFNLQQMDCNGFYGIVILLGLKRRKNGDFAEFTCFFFFSFNRVLFGKQAF
jgi:hypothetical protein